MTDYIISSKLSNETVYAYYRGRFWRWDGSIWKESHLMTQKFERAKAADKKLTPQEFLTNGAEFAPLDEYEIDCAMLDALKNAKPCKNAPIEPMEEHPTPSVQCSDAATAAGSQTAASPAAPEGSSPTTELATAADAPGVPVSADENAPVPSSTAPTFDFGADDQTNALLLQDAQTFITGNMARIMAAKHAHDLTANHYQGSWGKWCTAVGISRDTGDNMVRVAEQFGNIQLEGKSILDVQPLKLLYAAAKPSTPTQVKQAVFSGDITSYKEYQELLAQIKAEKDRADAAETREEEARKAAHEYHEKYEEAAAMRATLLDQQGVYIADIDGLKKQNTKLKQIYRDEYESRIAANLQRQKAEGERDRAEARAKNAEDALKKQPITAVIDEEEIDRRAAEKAWGLADARNAELAKDNANLKKQVAALRSRINDDAQADFEQANYCASLMRAAWDNSKASYSRLMGEDLESTFQTICGTLNSIMEEASLLCRQPPDYDGGDRDE